MIRTLLIYLAVLTSAEFMSSRQAYAVEQQPVSFEEMAPVRADGKDIAPKIMDFTNDADADQKAQAQKHTFKNMTKR